MDVQRQQLCPRLVDYLTIVGARPYTSGKGLAPVQVSLLLDLYCGAAVYCGERIGLSAGELSF